MTADEHEHAAHEGYLRHGLLHNDEHLGLPLRRRLSLAYETYERPSLFVLATVALVLGFVGFRKYLPPEGRGSIVDALLSDVELFKLKAHIGEGPIPLELNVARVLAPLVAGIVAFRSAVAVYRDRLDQLRTRRRRGHVVVVGLNTASWATVRALRSSGRKVLVVDELDQESVNALRSIGASSVSARGTTAVALHQARVQRASHVVAMRPDDLSNLEHGLTARKLLAGRTDRPQVVVCGTRPDFCSLLRLDDLTSAATSGPRLDFVSGGEMLGHDIVRQLPGPGPVLIDAPEVLGAHLVLRLARLNVGRRRTTDAVDARWSCVAIGEHGAASIAMARRCHDDLDDALTFEALSDAPDLHTFVGAIVCGDDASTIVEALDVSRRLPRSAVTVAGLPDATTFTSLVPDRDRSRVRLLDTSAWAGDVDLVIGGTFEVIARATHERYRSERTAAGVADASTHAWAELSPQLKASNRAQARHLGVKLASVNCGLAPLAGRADEFSFNAVEREQLSIMEHDRWVEERRSAGWTSGERDTAKLRTPYLVPWEQLTEDVRDLDRNAIDGLASFLADVGYQIVRR